MDYSVIIGAVAGAAVLLIGKGIDWYSARARVLAEGEKQRADISIPVNEQAVRVYREIVDSLRADMGKLVEGMHAQDEILLKCREQNVLGKAAAEAMGRDLEEARRRLAGGKP